MSKTLSLKHTGEGSSRTTSVSQADSKPWDFLATLLDGDKAVTGAQKFMQEGVLLAGGAMIHKYLTTGQMDPLAIGDGLIRK